MTETPTNVINMQARARLIREAQEAREKRKAERDVEVIKLQSDNMQALADAIASPAGPNEALQRLLRNESILERSQGLQAHPAAPETDADPRNPIEKPAFPGGIADMELAHFYKPPSTCQICGSISAPGAKVCLTCAVASEVDNMGV